MSLHGEVRIVFMDGNLKGGSALVPRRSDGRPVDVPDTLIGTRQDEQYAAAEQPPADGEPWPMWIRKGPR